MAIRTYGWVQNPSSFENLKRVVQIFDCASLHYCELKSNLLQTICFEDIKNSLQNKFNNDVTSFSYTELVGTSKDRLGNSPQTRIDAVADAIIQVSIIPQRVNRTGKTWTDNWTADGFLRWAVSLNFVEVDREQDIFFITKKGLLFSQSESGSEVELNVLRDAFLAYPPATQILSLLANEPLQYHTKFCLGEYLGFRGEKGFTSYNENIMFDWLNSANTSEEIQKIRADIEGTSDKYARGICNWLKKVGFVKTGQVRKPNMDRGFSGYKITGRGIAALSRSQGSSSSRQQQKFVMWEFFATDCYNRNYIRTRRAFIVKLLSRERTIEQLMCQLAERGFSDSKEVIELDIQGLRYFGLRIEQRDNRLSLQDRVNDFTIPTLNLTEELRNEELENRKQRFLRETELPMKYIELLEIAYDGKRNRDFEIITIELFREIYQMGSKLLGGGRKPDGIIYSHNFGVIIDTKAYSKGYGKNIRQADEMIRYIEDNQRRCERRNSTCWWTGFPPDIHKDNYYFLWISSKFINHFNEQILYTYEQTKIRGGALNVEQLLLGADLVRKGDITIDNLINYFQNQEIFFIDS